MTMTKSSYLKTEKVMKHLAKMIDKTVEFESGEKMGFVLIIFPFHKPGMGNYISNAKREGTIASLRELADRLEKRETIPPAEGEA